MSLTTKIYVLGALTLSLTVANPNFGNVAVQCGDGIAAQSYMGGLARARRSTAGF
jgi:hypothetical protein